MSSTVADASFPKPWIFSSPKHETSTFDSLDDFIMRHPSDFAGTNVQKEEAATRALHDLIEHVRVSSTDELIKYMRDNKASVIVSAFGTWPGNNNALHWLLRSVCPDLPNKYNMQYDEFECTLAVAVLALASFNPQLLSQYNHSNHTPLHDMFYYGISCSVLAVTGFGVTQSYFAKFQEAVTTQKMDCDEPETTEKESEWNEISSSESLTFVEQPAVPIIPSVVTEEVVHFLTEYKVHDKWQRRWKESIGRPTPISATKEKRPRTPPTLLHLLASCTNSKTEYGLLIDVAIDYFDCKHNIMYGRNLLTPLARAVAFIENLNVSFVSELLSRIGAEHANDRCGYEDLTPFTILCKAALLDPRLISVDENVTREHWDGPRGALLNLKKFNSMVIVLIRHDAQYDRQLFNSYVRKCKDPHFAEFVSNGIDNERADAARRKILVSEVENAQQIAKHELDKTNLEELDRRVVLQDLSVFVVGDPTLFSPSQEPISVRMAYYGAQPCMINKAKDSSSDEAPSTEVDKEPIDATDGTFVIANTNYLLKRLDENNSVEPEDFVVMAASMEGTEQRVATQIVRHYTFPFRSGNDEESKVVKVDSEPEEAPSDSIHHIHLQFATKRPDLPPPAFLSLTIAENRGTETYPENTLDTDANGEISLENDRRIMCADIFWSAYSTSVGCYGKTKEERETSEVLKNMTRNDVICNERLINIPDRDQPVFARFIGGGGSASKNWEVRVTSTPSSVPTRMVGQSQREHFICMLMNIMFESGTTDQMREIVKNQGGMTDNVIREIVEYNKEQILLIQSNPDEYVPEGIRFDVETGKFVPKDIESDVKDKLRFKTFHTQLLDVDITLTPKW